MGSDLQKVGATTGGAVIGNMIAPGIGGIAGALVGNKLFGGGSGDDGPSLSEQIALRQMQLAEEIARPQINYMNTVLPYRSESAGGVHNVLMDKINNRGIGTEYENSLIRTMRNRLNKQYNDSATRGSEALAGRGMLNSPVANKFILANEADRKRGEENIQSDILQKQYDDLWKTISAMLTFSGSGPNTLGIPGVNSPQEAEPDNSGMEALGQIAALGMQMAPMLV
jgi:hypothetical protein